MAAAGRIELTSLDAAGGDAQLAVAEYDDARTWLADNGPMADTPLAVEVWIFSFDLDQVLLVDHRWRRWVPPGGKVERGELPREAAMREVAEETGLRVELRREPAAVAVRSYAREWAPTLGLSYVAVVDPGSQVRAETDQPLGWFSLQEPWSSWFPDDIERMRAYVATVRGSEEGDGGWQLAR